jgi:hypothetical protein
MNKDLKWVLIMVFALAILVEGYLLITQCNQPRMVDIMRLGSCKNDDITLPVVGCYQDVLLNIKISSPAEFLFITDKFGNPVLTTLNIIICGLALNLLLRLKAVEFQIKDLIGLKMILIFIAIKLFIQSWISPYMHNWFSGNPLLNNTGYALKDEYSNMYLYIFWLVIVGILMSYLNRQIHIRTQQTNKIPLY